MLAILYVGLNIGTIQTASALRIYGNSTYEVGRDEIYFSNRVAGGISPPAPTPPGMRVRTGRFTEITGP